MILFKFMNNLNLKNNATTVDRVKNKYKDAYGIALSSELLSSDYEKMKQLLERTIKKEKKQIPLILKKEEKQNEPYSMMLEEICRIVYDFSSYEADLLSLIYMGLLHNDYQTNYFLRDVDADIMNLIDMAKESEGKEKNELETIISELKEIQRKREAIQSAWGRKSNDNKIDKDNARKHYPTQVSDEWSVRDIIKGEELRIQSIPGGCFEFHHTLISMENIGLFDVGAQNSSIKRYSFGRALAIYSRLKDTDIENLLLMEYALGIGYTNQICTYLQGIQSTERLKSFKELICCGVKVPYFFIRKELVEVIWKYVDFEGVENKDDDIKQIKDILEEALNIISGIMKKLLNIWWFPYYLYSTDKEKYSLYKYLECKWGQYYNDNKLYTEYIKFLRVNDWRNVESVEDCFMHIDKFCSEMQKYGKMEISVLEENKTRVDVLIDEDKNVRYFYTELPVNEIGKEVHEEALRKLGKISAADQSKDIYVRYYRFRKEEFEKKKEEELKILYDTDVRVSNKGIKQMKLTHRYAIIHNTVMDTLLDTLVTLRNF